MFRALLKTLVITAIVGMGLFKLAGGNILSVQSDSMAPVFKLGDALVVRSVHFTDLHVGDVISYHSPSNKRMVVSHRLIGINHKTGMLITEGDALDLQDAPVPAYLLIGRAQTVVPHAGKIIDGIRQPLVLLAALYIPAAWVMAMEFKRLVRSYSRPYYQLYGYHSKH